MRKHLGLLTVSFVLTMFLVSCDSFMKADFGESEASPIASLDSLKKLMLDDGRLTEYPGTVKPLLGQGTTHRFKSRHHMSGLGDIFISVGPGGEVQAIVVTFARNRHMWIHSFAKKLWERDGGGEPDFKRERRAFSPNPAKFSALATGNGFSMKWVQYEGTNIEFVIFALDQHKDALFSMEK